MKKNIILIISITFVILIVIQGYNKYTKNIIYPIKNDNSGVQFSILSNGGMCQGGCGEEKTIITKDSIISYYKSNNGKIKNYKEKPMDSKKWENLIQSLDLKALESVVFPINCRSCQDVNDITLTILYEGKSLYIDYDANLWYINLFGSKEDKEKVINFLNNFEKIYPKENNPFIENINSKILIHRENFIKGIKNIDCPEGLKKLLGNLDTYMECAYSSNKTQLIYNDVVKNLITVKYNSLIENNINIIKQKYIFLNDLGDIIIIDKNIDDIYNSLKWEGTQLILSKLNIRCEGMNEEYEKCHTSPDIEKYKKFITDNNQVSLYGTGNFCTNFSFKNYIIEDIKICNNNGIIESKGEIKSIANLTYLEALNNAKNQVFETYKYTANIKFNHQPSYEEIGINYGSHGLEKNPKANEHLVTNFRDFIYDKNKAIWLFYIESIIGGGNGTNNFKKNSIIKVNDKNGESCIIKEYGENFNENINLDSLINMKCIE